MEKKKMVKDGEKQDGEKKDGKSDNHHTYTESHHHHTHHHTHTETHHHISQNPIQPRASHDASPTPPASQKKSWWRWDGYYLDEGNGKWKWC